MLQLSREAPACLPEVLLGSASLQSLGLGPPLLPEACVPVCLGLCCGAATAGMRPGAVAAGSVCPCTRGVGTEAGTASLGLAGRPHSASAEQRSSLCQGAVAARSCQDLSTPSVCMASLRWELCGHWELCLLLLWQSRGTTAWAGLEGPSEGIYFSLRQEHLLAGRCHQVCFPHKTQQLLGPSRVEVPRQDVLGHCFPPEVPRAAGLLLLPGEGKLEARALG